MIRRLSRRATDCSAQITLPQPHLPTLGLTPQSQSKHTVTQSPQKAATLNSNSPSRPPVAGALRSSARFTETERSRATFEHSPLSDLGDLGVSNF